MKVGFRTPNLKKRLKARTTGKIKRKMKKAINPFYSKKGMGFIKNPVKSIKSSIYHKTTIDSIGMNKKTNKQFYNSLNDLHNSKKDYNKKTMLILCSLGFIGFGGIHDFYLGYIGKGLLKFFTVNWFVFGTVIDLIKICSDNY